MNDQANSVDERYEAAAPANCRAGIAMTPPGCWDCLDGHWRRHPVLPINAGLGGFWPLVILALLAFPMTFFAHRGLTRFVLSGREGADITDVVEEHFGIKAGALITLLYFFAIFPILLIYSVA
jgi:serine transporter